MIRAVVADAVVDLDPAQNRRFVQYLLVGVAGIGVNQGTLFLATGVVGLPYLLGGFLGQVVSLSINYGINDAWTWGEYGSPGVRSWAWRGIKYGGTRVVGIALHLLTLTALVELLRVHYLLANLVAIGVGVVWGFGASDGLVWRVGDGIDD